MIISRFLKAGLMLTACALMPLAEASCLGKRLTGVNIGGAEFSSSKLPGVYGKDYIYPSEQEISYVAAQGATVIRLPFRWERVQHTIFGNLDPDEVTRIRNTITSANAKDVCVLLDVHNYAKFGDQQLAGNTQLQDAFVDLWQRLAQQFTDPTGVAFGLMNEPNYITIAEWGQLSKRTLAKLREAGATNLVFISGGRWSGVHDWFNEQNGVSNATAFANVNDPLKRTILEVHQYADSDYSGTKSECRTADQFNPIFDKLTAWAQANGQQLFLGEFGMPQTVDCMLDLERFLSLMTDPVWKGWSYWAAGSWWGKYPLAINTSATDPSPQWPILKKYFYVPPINNAPMPPLPLIRKSSL